MTWRGAIVLAAVLLAPSVARAQAAWLRDRLDVEWVVAAGQKRFELRTGRGFDKTTVTIETRGTLVKDTSLPEASCATRPRPPPTRG